jgi:putative ABC transport system permease protein
VGSPHVVIVNETAVAKHWPGIDPIGQRIRYTGMDSHRDDWMTVIGVVGDVHQVGLAVPAEPETYVPFAQRPERLVGGGTIVMRSPLDPALLSSAIRERIHAVDADVPTTIRRSTASSWHRLPTGVSRCSC